MKSPKSRQVKPRKPRKPPTKPPTKPPRKSPRKPPTKPPTKPPRKPPTNPLHRAGRNLELEKFFPFFIL